MSETVQVVRRVPTLVQYCQRVASLHVDAISSLGNDVRYALIEPILQNCTPESLHRLEQASPHIRRCTTSIWKEICIRDFPTAVENRLAEGGEPKSWRDLYFALRAAEAKRLEEVGFRIRSQRLEAEERKKDREVKLTDRIPPTKRSRNGSAQPSTLFQKARTEASKIQKAMYNARMIPPTPHKDSRVKPAALTYGKSPIDQPTTVAVNSAVTVRTVTVHRSLPLPGIAASSKHKPQPQGFGPSLDHKKGLPPPSLVSSSRMPASESRLQKVPVTPKKDPMAALFMPKHRAHSQLPEPPTASTSMSKPLFVTDKYYASTSVSHSIDGC